MSDQGPEIIAILKEIKVLGLAVHNIHQRVDGMWCANLRSRKPAEVNTTPRTTEPLAYYAWGRGPDMLGALESSLVRWRAREKLTGKVIHDDEREIDDQPMGLEDDADDLEDLNSQIANLLD